MWLWSPMAGMPAVSDPGSNVVSEIAAKGFPVEVIPGVSAVTAGLSVSGMTGDAFLFLGFLPRRGKERRECLQRAAAAAETVVLFESPHRLAAPWQISRMRWGTGACP